MAASDVGGVPLLTGHVVREMSRDGREVGIRALRPEDRAALMAAVGRVSAESLYRRFFGARREFADREIDFFVNVDFVNHVALVAEVEEAGLPTIVGGGRYVVVQPGTAELAFAVVDEYQGQSIGSALLRHLIEIARSAGLTQLVADVLPDNSAMLKVLQRSGLPLSKRSEGRSVHVSLRLG